MKKRDKINRRKFVSHVATGTALAFGMGVMCSNAYAKSHGGSGSDTIFVTIGISF